MREWYVIVLCGLLAVGLAGCHGAKPEINAEIVSGTGKKPEEVLALANDARRSLRRVVRLLRSEKLGAVYFRRADGNLPPTVAAAATSLHVDEDVVAKVIEDVLLKEEIQTKMERLLDDTQTPGSTMELKVSTEAIYQERTSDHVSLAVEAATNCRTFLESGETKAAVVWFSHPELKNDTIDPDFETKDYHPNVRRLTEEVLHQTEGIDDNDAGKYGWIKGEQPTHTAYMAAGLALEGLAIDLEALDVRGGDGLLPAANLFRVNGNALLVSLVGENSLLYSSPLDLTADTLGAWSNLGGRFTSGVSVLSAGEGQFSAVGRGPNPVDNPLDQLRRPNHLVELRFDASLAGSDSRVLDDERPLLAGPTVLKIEANRYQLFYPVKGNDPTRPQLGYAYVRDWLVGVGLGPVAQIPGGARSELIPVSLDGYGQGVLFGGAYSVLSVNPATGRRDCPTGSGVAYRPFKVSEDPGDDAGIWICLAPNRYDGTRGALLFGGMWSRTPEAADLTPPRVLNNRFTNAQSCPADYQEQVLVSSIVAQTAGTGANLGRWHTILDRKLVLCWRWSASLPYSPYQLGGFLGAPGALRAMIPDRATCPASFVRSASRGNAAVWLVAGEGVNHDGGLYQRLDHPLDYCWTAAQHATLVTAHGVPVIARSAATGRSLLWNQAYAAIPGLGAVTSLAAVADGPVVQLFGVRAGKLMGRAYHVIDGGPDWAPLSDSLEEVASAPSVARVGDDDYVLLVRGKVSGDLLLLRYRPGAALVVKSLGKPPGSL